MIAEERYKELVINTINEKNEKVTAFTIKCNADSTDKDIFDVFNKIKPMMNTNVKIDINYINKGVIDVDAVEPIKPKPPIPPYVPEVPKEPIINGNDTLITINKLEDFFALSGYTDEDFYGAACDGKDRKYRLIYVLDGIEKFVPLKGFDVEDATLPHKIFEFNSDSNKLLFNVWRTVPTNYIIRKMF